VCLLETVPLSGRRELNRSGFRQSRSRIESSKNPGTDRLSAFEVDLIGELSPRHEHEDQWAIAECCHELCGEWLPLAKSAEVISVAELAEEIGRDPSEATLLVVLRCLSQVIAPAI
jgi:hypothetical protein